MRRTATATMIGAAGITLVATLFAQNPPAQQQQQQQQQQQPPPPTGQRGGGGGQRGGRGGVQTMTLLTNAWHDGGIIPVKHSQAGRDVSPPLWWTDPPSTATSFVLLVHDLDVVNQNATTSMLHWLVWNIPATSRHLSEGIPATAELADGTRQISQTGPYYRGPAASGSGPAHHYAFELFAIEGSIDVPAVGASPAETRAAVFAAMAGKVRGKGTLLGTFKRALSPQ